MTNNNANIVILEVRGSSAKSTPSENGHQEAVMSEEISALDLNGLPPDRLVAELSGKRLNVMLLTMFKSLRAVKDWTPETLEVVNSFYRTVFQRLLYAEPVVLQEFVDFARHLNVVGCLLERNSQKLPNPERAIELKEIAIELKSLGGIVCDTYWGAVHVAEKWPIKKPSVFWSRPIDEFRVGWGAMITQYRRLSGDGGKPQDGLAAVEAFLPAIAATSTFRYMQDSDSVQDWYARGERHPTSESRRRDLRHVGFSFDRNGNAVITMLTRQTWEQYVGVTAGGPREQWEVAPIVVARRGNVLEQPIIIQNSVLVNGHHPSDLDNLHLRAAHSACIR